MTKFKFPETTIAQAKGLTHEYVGELRKKALEEGVHWEMVKGSVCYSSPGLEALEEVLLAEKKDRADTAAQVKEELDRTVMATVTRVYTKNTRAIEAMLPDGKVVVVAVARNDNFTPLRRNPVYGKPDIPMTIKLHVGPRGEVCFIGRLPRRRGEW